MSDSGNRATGNSGPAKSGGSNRRKRNYRHFGPQGSTTDASASRETVRTGPVEQKRETGSDRSSQQESRNPTQVKPSGNAQSGDQAKRSVSRSRNRNNRNVQNRPQTSSAAPAVQPKPKTDNAEPAQQNKNQKKVKANQPTRPERSNPLTRQKRVVRWDKKISAEETYEDIRSDIERIEKEIWLEIAGLHTITLDY
ncbi:MAG: hypothetical protein GX173_12160 [Ruminococcaceae bacterium]|jgi:hypothetical protein|nr:hypothetical protein [Oscillospiraceae bacterium]